MSYFTLKNGEKLYYEDKGNGPDTLVMMHGWTSSHEIYAQPAETLQEQARCIIYDHRGHSGSLFDPIATAQDNPCSIIIHRIRALYNAAYAAMVNKKHNAGSGASPFSKKRIPAEGPPDDLPRA